MRQRAVKLVRNVLTAGALTLVACADSDRPAGPVVGSKLFVDSDPRGANIVVDGVLTTRLTPDTVRDLTAEAHDIGARLERGGVTYSWTSQIDRNGINGSLVLPLLARCPGLSCLTQLAVLRTAGTIRYATNPAATLFFTGQGGGLLWPAVSRNSYAVAGSPVFAGKVSGGQPVGLGVYSHTVEYPVPYWAGRPPTGATAGAPGPSQTIWIVPPPYFQGLPATVRGLEITWNVIEQPSVADALLIQVIFRNISNRASYRVADPLVTASGLTYDSAYIGFAIDPDIGAASDDFVSYAPNLSTVFAYDGDFRELDFSPNAQNPGLIGLRLLTPGNARVVLNSWPIALLGQPLDWFYGNANEWFGWDMLSRRQSILPYQSADQRIGFVPNAASDYRMSVSMGPLRLAPGDSAVLNVAVAMALPVPGTYSIGLSNAPGDPTVESRPIMLTAAALLDKLREVGALPR